MFVQLVTQPFDPGQILQHHQNAHLSPGSYGATASFVGTMRDFSEDAKVDSLLLEHYPGMTERELEKIVKEAHARWAVLDTLVVHRVGEVSPGEPIVLVVVWSKHRMQAFEACRWIMEALKSRAPFWKKERGPEGERWIENNTPGY